MAQDGRSLVWMDLEMTGLYPEKDRIIEMATVITDSDLRIIAEGPVIAINQPTELLDGMDEWNTRTHGRTGLTEKVKASAITELVLTITVRTRRRHCSCRQRGHWNQCSAQR